MIDTSKTAIMVYHENGGNESFIVGSRSSRGGFMSTLKAGSDTHFSHNMLVLTTWDDKDTPNESEDRQFL